MIISHVLGVVPVTDLDAATDWYERLLGRPADNRPMDSLADWHITDGGWLQVFRNPDDAGSTSLNFAVVSLDDAISDISARGIRAGEIIEATAGVRLLPLKDPDGNTVTLIENPR